MKYFFMMSLFLSLPSFAGNCTIAFENELTPSSDKVLFEEAQEFKNILLSRGYTLRSIKNGLAQYHGFITSKGPNAGYTLTFHSNVHPEINIYETSHNDDDLATEALFKKLPICRSNNK